jgi:hypothetical protein
MSTKTYTVRVPLDAPDTTSDHVSQWLESQLTSPTALAPDPGAGERSLRLSLDKEEVARGARSADEPEATFLRRLIATNVPMSQEEKEESKTQARPRAPVLKGALKLRPEQIRPVVRGFEAAQSYAIRQAFHVPEAVEAASFTEQERDELSVATSEVLNRRAPQLLVENIDLVGLATTVIAIESRKIEQVQAAAQYLRQQQARQASQQPEARQGQVEGIS